MWKGNDALFRMSLKFVHLDSSSDWKEKQKKVSSLKKIVYLSAKHVEFVIKEYEKRRETRVDLVDWTAWRWNEFEIIYKRESWLAGSWILKQKQKPRDG